VGPVADHKFNPGKQLTWRLGHMLMLAFGDMRSGLFSQVTVR
jgi:hypothetical protein